MSPLRSVIGSVSAIAGILGATAIGGMTARRMALHRYRDPDEPAGAGPPGAFTPSRTDRSYSVAAADGVALHVEEVGRIDAPLTIIFSHGWTLNLGSWYFQREMLSGQDYRQVFYDQRSHGRSSASSPGRSTIRDLAEDLSAVIDTAAPTGRVALVGHSMGGMAIMALAGLRPDLFADRMAAVALISTSANENARSLRNLTRINGSNPLLPWAAAFGRRYPGLTDRGRSMGHDAVWLATRSLGFAQPDVPAPLVDFLDDMVSATPMQVIAEFAPAVLSHDETACLPTLSTVPTLVLVGDKDRMTPPDRGRAIADKLGEAELLIIPEAGHMAILETPEAVNRGLAELLRRALVARGEVGK